MKAGDLAKFEADRRYATLVAVAVESQAALTDEIIDLNDRIMGGLFSRAKRSHEQQFQQSGKQINEKVRLYWKVGNALLEAKQSGAWRSRPLEAQPYVYLDARYERVRQGGIVQKAAVLTESRRPDRKPPS
jgi:hypothetical protein